MTDSTEQMDGTFVVTHADAESAVLRDVDSGQVHTVAAGEFAVGDVLEATLEPVPPLDVMMEPVEIHARHHIEVSTSPEPPTRQERNLAAEQTVGDLTKEDRAGKGQLHVMSVPPAETEAAVDDVVDDDETLARAARMPAVERVEVRSDADEGIVSVRYLP